MSDKAANIVCAIATGVAAVYMIWQLQRVEAEAMPIAGASKQIAEANNEARLNVFAGFTQAMTEVFNEKETPRNKIRDRPTYTYASDNTLNRRKGKAQGPSGTESYYNLPMAGVIRKMRSLGYTETYWVRRDGVKMFGDYVIVAADLDIRPRGTILDTTLGKAIVCDTGTFIYSDRYALDVAVNW